MLPYIKLPTDSALFTLKHEDAGELVLAINEYVRYGTEATLSDASARVWAFMKHDIDEQIRKYDAMCQRNKRNVTSRYDSLPLATTRYDSLPVVDLESEKDNEKERTKEKDTEKEKEKETLSKESSKKRTVFRPPTVEEVQAYCAERKNTVDAHVFVDFYTAKDWMVGKNRMRDWRAAVRTWERSRGDSPKKRYNAALDYKQTPIDEADFSRMVVNLDDE